MKKIKSGLLITSIALFSVGCSNTENNSKIEQIEREYIEAGNTIDPKVAEANKAKKVTPESGSFYFNTSDKIYNLKDSSMLLDEYNRLISEMKDEFKEIAPSELNQLMYDDFDNTEERDRFRTYHFEVDRDKNGAGDIHEQGMKDFPQGSLLGMHVSSDVQKDTVLVEENIDVIKKSQQILETELRYVMDTNKFNIKDTYIEEFIKNRTGVEFDLTKIQEELDRLLALPDEEKPVELTKDMGRSHSLLWYATDSYYVSITVAKEYIVASADLIYNAVEDIEEDEDEY